MAHYSIDIERDLFARNAYVDAPVSRPGCEHRLGCRCTTPFWLRERTEEERESELLRGMRPPIEHGPGCCCVGCLEDREER